jgi:Zn finger protein HypA/HybF involved in hydrogenase expression
MDRFVSEIPYTCPVCGSKDVKVIQYGYARSGMTTGGCVKKNKSPYWICPRCQTRFIPDINLKKWVG